eukprot:m.60047 g.60047  ORF g.60047 m.60047 type:complete len:187 (+) comp15728_c0_seq2:21-581(+)
MHGRVQMHLLLHYVWHTTSSVLGGHALVLLMFALTSLSCSMVDGVYSVCIDVADGDRPDGEDNDNTAGDDGNGAQEFEQQSVLDQDEQEPIAERETAEEMLAKFRAKQQQKQNETPQPAAVDAPEQSVATASYSDDDDEISDGGMGYGVLIFIIAVVAIGLFLFRRKLFGGNKRGAGRKYERQSGL